MKHSKATHYRSFHKNIKVINRFQYHNHLSEVTLHMSILISGQNLNATFLLKKKKRIVQKDYRWSYTG